MQELPQRNVKRFGQKLLQLLENIIVDKKEDKCPYYQIYGKMPDYSTYLRTFGEVEIVPLKAGDQMKAKFG